jgi:hypothetical protein
MPRWFLNLPAFRTVADVDAYCARLGVVNAAGYWASDGVRVCVELSEVAMAELAEQAANIERRAAELETTAERMRP